MKRAATIKDDPVLAPAVEDGTLQVSDASAVRKESESVKVAVVEKVKETRGKTTAKKAAAEIALTSST